MQVASLSSSSNVIGDSGLTLTVSFTTVSPFKSGYELQLKVPVYNPNAAAVNPGDMITSATPTCIGTLGMNSGLSCSFDTTTRILQLLGVSSTDLPGGTVMTFTVDNFRNPYNGMAKTGF